MYYKALRYGWNPSEFAGPQLIVRMRRLTGFSLRALAEWASGKLPSQPAKRRLHEVRRLLDMLAQIVKPESIPGWLHAPNKTFDGLTPLQVIELGEIDRLWAMVHDLGSGQAE